MDSLILIPDISGFTAFVNETEVKHSKHIIAELLELVIESDQLGLTVAEVEGDAILFYKEGEVPELNALVEQAKKTFTEFHMHLKNYETRRICPCGACCNAHSLTIKFIALRASLDFIKVKQFQKPYGSDVILAHRLLKNEVDSDEYLLIESGYWNPDAEIGDPGNGLSFIEGMTSYPNFGDVAYRYISLEKWHDTLPDPVPPPEFTPIKNPIRVGGNLASSLFDVYELISNLDLRLQWNTGVNKLDYEKERVNRIGTRHQCVVQGNLIDFETIAAKFGENTIVYGEQVDRNPLVQQFAVFWILQEREKGTHLVIELHYFLKPFPMSLIGFFFRWNARRQVERMFNRIREIAEASYPITP